MEENKSSKPQEEVKEAEVVKDSAEKTSTAQGPKTEKKPMSTGIKVAIGCGIAVILLTICGVIAVVLGMGKLGDSLDDLDLSSSSSSTSAGVGEKVDVKGIEWTVVEAKDMGASMVSNVTYVDSCDAEEGKFIFVKMKIKNNTSEEVYMLSTYIYDSNDTEYQSSFGVYACTTNTVTAFDAIKPGEEVIVEHAYDVKTDASGFKLKVTNMEIFGEKTDYIDLGL